MGEFAETVVLNVGQRDELFTVPSLDPATGHLPPGRYRTSLSAIEECFVLGAEFVASTTRAPIWDGFINYLRAWKESQMTLGYPILKTLWIGGSFTSNLLNPEDIDISPVYDQDVVDDLHNQPGIGKLKKLVGHRQSMVKTYGVEPFPLPWRSLASTLHPSTLPEHAQAYLAKRGGLDDWWQRVRPVGKKVAPTAPDAAAARGYLEVPW